MSSEWDKLWELYPFDLLEKDNWGAPLLKADAVKIKAIGDKQLVCNEAQAQMIVELQKENSELRRSEPEWTRYFDESMMAILEQKKKLEAIRTLWNTHPTLDKCNGNVHGFLIEQRKWIQKLEEIIGHET